MAKSKGDMIIHLAVSFSSVLRSVAAYDGWSMRQSVGCCSKRALARLGRLADGILPIYYSGGSYCIFVSRSQFDAAHIGLPTTASVVFHNDVRFWYSSAQSSSFPLFSWNDKLRKEIEATRPFHNEMAQHHELQPSTIARLASTLDSILQVSYIDWSS